MKNEKTIGAKELNKTVRPIPTLKELAVATMNDVYNDIMSLDQDTVEILMVIHKLAREKNTDTITYGELVESLPFVPKGEYPAWHLIDLEHCNLISTQVYFNQDGSEEMLIYLGAIHYLNEA